MSRLSAGIAVLDAMSRARAQAEQQAGQLWQDTVLRRLTERNLAPLAEEERRFLRAVTAFDHSIDRALRELGNH